MQIHAVVQKHANFGIIGLVAEDFAHPVISGKIVVTIFSGLLPLCDADCAEMDEDPAFPQPPKIPEASKRQKNTANIRLNFFIEMRSIV